VLRPGEARPSSCPIGISTRSNRGLHIYGNSSPGSPGECQCADCILPNASSPHVERCTRLFDGHGVHIFIVEQSADDRKFNRGKLLNIGFDLACKAGGYETFVFHDVDLIPSPELVPSYTQKPDNPVHIARVWDR
jgi:hypothetical protein